MKRKIMKSGCHGTVNNNEKDNSLDNPDSNKGFVTGHIVCDLFNKNQRQSTTCGRPGFHTEIKLSILKVTSLGIFIVVNNIVVYELQT
uniref:Uncharacterized protein n=1 Tax=Octopus bimaculoides TaxID=37653 RepID=A0A0L8II41_OCTBM